MTTLTHAITLHDAQIVSTFVGALFGELRGLPEEQRRPLDLSLVKRTLQATDRICGYLLYEDSDPVGLIMLSEGYALFAEGRYGVITELYVRPERRSSGCAKLLIERAELHALEKGWNMLEVGAPSQPKWARSLGFYLTNGFSEVGPRLRKRMSERN